MTDFIVNTDGGARGNPGPAGAGVVIATPDGVTVAELSKELGTATNNQAEYWALIFALERVRALQAEGHGSGVIEVRMDSELIVRQLSGEYKVRNEGLKPLYERVTSLCQNLGVVKFVHVPRRQNKRADELANEAMDRVERHA